MSDTVKRLLDSPWAHAISRDGSGHYVTKLQRGRSLIVRVAPTFAESVTAALDAADVDDRKHRRRRMTPRRAGDSLVTTTPTDTKEED